MLKNEIEKNSIKKRTKNAHVLCLNIETVKYWIYLDQRRLTCQISNSDHKIMITL